MRIKTNDVSVTPYTKSTVIGSDGYETITWSAGTAIAIDLQPIGNARARLAEFGPDVADPLSRIGYVDKGLLTQNAYIVASGQAYQVRGFTPWYTHDEVFLVPYQGSIA